MARESGSGLLSATRGLRRRRALDRCFTAALALAAAAAVAVLLVIFGYVLAQGGPALGLAFFTQPPRPFGETGGGVAHAILGSLLMLAVACLLGVTVGIGSAVFLSEYGRGPFATAVRFALDLLAGLPSIVVGVFVWALLVRHRLGRYSGVAGSVALAMIMIPIVARTVEEVLKLVPATLREASLALGLPRWKTILRVVLPTARAGILTGTVLAASRAGGETAPLLMTALGNEFSSLDLGQPMAALPLQIYVYAKGPYPDWHVKAWGASLVLLVVIAALSLAARLVVRRGLGGRLRAAGPRRAPR